MSLVERARQLLADASVAGENRSIPAVWRPMTHLD